MMKIDILTLFPEMCEAFINESIIGRAVKNNKVCIKCHNIRDYTKDKHNRVDDAPYGGGMGMIMSAQPIYDCFMSLFGECEEKPYCIYMSPKGNVFTQKKACELSNKEHIVLLCGHYEGVDQRVIDEIVDEEISIGDYVLTGGEMPALIVADAISRLLPGVLSDDVCFEDESHYSGLLEYPQYTRPNEWRGREVPEVLLSGHHANIVEWRRHKSLEETYKKRPDMLDAANLSKKDKEYLKSIKD